MLADKSLIHITPTWKTVHMHTLLRKLGREIVRGESIINPGKRRFLVAAKDISDVFKYNYVSVYICFSCLTLFEFSQIFWCLI